MSCHGGLPGVGALAAVGGGMLVEERARAARQAAGQEGVTGGVAGPRGGAKP